MFLNYLQILPAVSEKNTLSNHSILGFADSTDKAAKAKCSDV